LKTQAPTTTTTRERVLLLLAASFLVTGAMTLTLSIPRSLTFPLLLAAAVWVGAFTAAHLFLSRRLPHRDPFLLPVTALLTGWGLLLIGRLASNFLVRQSIWLAISTGALMAVVHLSRDLRWLRRFRYTWLLGGLVLLAATLVFGVNPSGFGLRLWLGAFGIYFQPVELLKLLMIAFLASYLAERKELLVGEGIRIGRWRLPPLAYVGPMVAMFGLAMILLASQQDLGAAMLFFFTFLAMLHLATGQWGYVAAGLVLFCAVGVTGYYLSDKVALRIDGWLNPWPEAADRAFQIVQSLLALGSGGVFGRGLGLGNPTYIPAVHTDFVFAALAEEFGLLGVLGIIALYTVLMMRGFRAAAHARPPFERFLAAGLTAGLVIQAWVIMAGNAKLAPIAGVTLPFVSYGGSSILTSFVAVAFLLRVSNRAPEQRAARSSGPLLQVMTVLTVSLALLAATCGYWSVAQAQNLRAREDDPRRVLYEQRVVRGRILDRDGVTLADVEIAPDGTVTRIYPVPEATPAVGFASLRYGTGGIERTYDANLRGETDRTAWQATWDDLLHRPPHGHDVQLTLDVTLQTQAQEALAEQTGAVILLDAVNGDILALASSPTYDPMRLDETWDALREDPAAPLVNRVTQGLYQPGSVLQTVIIAEALESGLADLSDPAPGAAEEIPIDGANLGCVVSPEEPYTLRVAYAAGCPAPFADLGEQLGGSGLSRAIWRWGLSTTPPPLEIPSEAADWDARALTSAAAMRAEGIGQGELTVTPLQMARVAATLANEGTMVAPRLVLSIQSAEGYWEDQPAPDDPHVILSADHANDLLESWTLHGEGVRYHLGMAAAGESQPPHVWFLGVTKAGDSSYIAVVLLEHPDDTRLVIDIGAALLNGVTR
jgi:cell division protein FtsW (lipid II flippase)